MKGLSSYLIDPEVFFCNDEFYVAGDRQSWVGGYLYAAIDLATLTVLVLSDRER